MSVVSVLDSRTFKLHGLTAADSKVWMPSKPMVVPPTNFWRFGVHPFVRAVIIGASIAGLLAARVLSDFADSVTLIDRDVPPDSPVPRKGVPRGRHVHGVLADGYDVLKSFFQASRRNSPQKVLESATSPKTFSGSPTARGDCAGGEALSAAFNRALFSKYVSDAALPDSQP